MLVAFTAALTGLSWLTGSSAGVPLGPGMNGSLAATGDIYTVSMVGLIYCSIQNKMGGRERVKVKLIVVKIDLYLYKYTV